MSEQEKPKSFMQELESWANKEIIGPLLDNGPVAIPDVHQAIKEKVLQSYRNGQQAGPRVAKAPQRGGR